MYRLFLYGSTDEDELRLEVVEILCNKGDKMSKNKDILECLICGKKVKNLGQHFYYSHKTISNKNYYGLKMTFKTLLHHIRYSQFIMET